MLKEQLIPEADSVVCNNGGDFLLGKFTNHHTGLQVDLLGFHLFFHTLEKLHGLFPRKIHATLV